MQTYFLPASHNDVSVTGTSVHVVRIDQHPHRLCFGGIPDPVSKDRCAASVCFDISDVSRPKLVQECRDLPRSHTHTVVTQPGDNDNIYIYVSGSGGVRPAENCRGCSTGSMDTNPDTASFRIEVIKVPLAAPQNAASSVRRASSLAGGSAKPWGWRGRRCAPTPPVAVAGAPAPAVVPRAPAAAGRISATTSRCIPAAGLAGGACNGLGLLLDFASRASSPHRLRAESEHVALAFSHIQQRRTKMLFSD